MFDMKESVWNRYDASGKEISANLYNVIIGLTLMWGFLVNYIMVKTIPVESILAIPWFLLIIGYLISVFAGIMIFTNSDKPLISFIGYNLVVLPIGIVLTPFVAAFDPEIVQRAVAVTGLVTLMMTILGSAYPQFFLSIGRALFGALLSVILIEILLIVFTGHSSPIIDWIVVFIFAGYIGFDWARANNIPYTVDNAVDSAAALYIDIINLFIRILSILGRSSD